MNLPNHLSCLLLLSFGTSLPADDLQAPKHPGEEFQGLPNEPGFGEAGGVKWRRSPVDLNPLFSIAKELQSFGKEKAGIQFRFGRQDTDENLNAVTDLLKEDGEKEANNLESITERRNGYYDGKKTGLSIWLARRKREALRAKVVLKYNNKYWIILEGRQDKRMETKQGEKQPGIQEKLPNSEDN